ncbi:family 43 glycosylhydrolase [Alloscardovia omnicolens]|uniref:family 43 glycosylhydrolase n=1 Tax=Alloscardovia omnicolens TaxID=419015 RepID=UPI003A65BD51
MTQLLACYTRKATGPQYANSQDSAYSAHFALRSNTSGQWEALNGNYGIVFAPGLIHSGVPQSARKAAQFSAVASSTQQVEGHVSKAVEENGLTPAVDISLKRLVNPSLFEACEGYGFVATQIARGAGLDGTGEGEGPDGSEQHSFIVAHTSNLADFDYDGLLRINTDNGVKEPQVIYDRREKHYEISWLDNNGVVRHAFSPDIFADARSGHIVDVADGDAQHSSRVSITVEDSLPASFLTISDDVARNLQARFGRIYNVGVRVNEVTISRDEAADPARIDQILREVTAHLEYSDGSEAERKVDWSKQDIEEISASSQSGTFHVSGSLRTVEYPVPFAVERADPSVISWTWRKDAEHCEQLYMFIATEDEKGNCIDPREGRTHMPLRVASNIYDLSDEAGGRDREIDLLKAGDKTADGRVMTGCFWAPELHVIAGRLSILFMPCFDGEEYDRAGEVNDRYGKPDMWTGRCHIMQLKQNNQGYDLDPRDPNNWELPEQIVSVDGGLLNPTELISLDMTVLEDSGTYYYLWQQVGSVWAATFDPEHPAQLLTRPQQIIFPEFSWDNVIAEGPNAFVYNGTIYLIYSGSSVGIEYTTGLATAPAQAGLDLTEPDSWTKLGYPIQKSSLFNGQWQLGTGHGMWSHDEDDNLIYVFHAAPYNDGVYAGRDAHVRRVHWSVTGLPVFDMQSDEEVNPQYEYVSVEVKVQ